MSIKNNTTSLQEVLEILNTKASGGEQATPEISVNSSNGLITATAGTKSSTYQLAFQAAKTITPSTVSQIAVSSGYYTGGNITVAGDSNLVAGNIKSGVSIFGVNGTAQVGGETVVDDVSRAIIEKTITEISDDELQVVGQYAFAYCYDLTTVSFPVCKTINDHAFTDCSSLTTVSFPVCTYIGNSAFTDSSSLTSVSFPACTSIVDFAFTRCYDLTTVSFPVCMSIGGLAFFQCYNLATVSFPVCKIIYDGAFMNCRSLTTASFPVCTSIRSDVFAACWCLSSLTLGASAVCKLSNSNAFFATPFAGYSSCFSGTPYIYVPASLVSAYQSATNWAYFSSYFSAIPGTEDEGGGSGGDGDTSESALITFTIDGIEYQAEENTTWAEWCNSNYNTEGYYIDENYIALDTRFMPVYVCTANGMNVESIDYIVSGAEYVTE